MNIYKLIIFGIIGLIIGYKVPDISNKIIKQKRPEADVNEVSFLNSNTMHGLIIIISVVLWALSGNGRNTVIGLLISILITLGLIITYIDIKIRIIPNKLVLTIIILGIVFQTINFGVKALVGAVISMLVMMAVFTAVAGFVGFGKVGAGDVKLAGAMGISLGYPLIITAVMVMAIVLLVFILIGMALKKIYLSTMIPFAPFMMVGYIAAFVSLLI